MDGSSYDLDKLDKGPVAQRIEMKRKKEIKIQRGQTENTYSRRNNMRMKRERERKSQ